MIRENIPSALFGSHSKLSEGGRVYLSNVQYFACGFLAVMAMAQRLKWSCEKLFYITTMWLDMIDVSCSSVYIFAETHHTPGILS